MSENDRDALIAQARKLDDAYVQQRVDDDGPGAYEGIADRELAAAVELIYLNGFADDQGGSTDYDGPHGARVGRYVLWTTHQGFLALDTFESEREAQDALDEVTREYNEPEV